MASLTGNAASSRRPANTVTGIGQVTLNQGDYALAAALAVNDTVELCKLPAQHIPVDFVLDTDDLDTGGSPAIVVEVGLYDLDQTTVVDRDAFILSSTVGQAGGMARMDNRAGFRIAPADVDRLVVLTVTTGPATGATTGTIKGMLFSRAKGVDD